MWHPVNPSNWIKCLQEKETRSETPLWNPDKFKILAVKSRKKGNVQGRKKKKAHPYTLDTDCNQTVKNITMFFKELCQHPKLNTFFET